MRGGLRMKTFKAIALLLVGTVSSLLLMGCGEIDNGTETSAWGKETATIVPEEPKTEIILGDIGGASGASPCGASGVSGSVEGLSSV